MDRNSIIGLILIFAIILGYSWYTQPSPEKLAQVQAQKDSIAQVEKKQSSDSLIVASEVKAIAPVLDSNELIAQYGGFAKHVNQELQVLKIENDKIELSISNKGAKPVSAILKEFYIPDSSRKVNLIDSSGNFGLAYSFSTKEKTVKTDNFYWDVVSKEANSITLRMYYGSTSKYLEQIYELVDGDYKVKYTFNIIGMESDMPPGTNTINLALGNKIPLQEGTVEAEKMATTVYWKYDEESPDYIRESSYDTEDLEESTKWISFKQQYFSTTFIPANSFVKGGKLETIEGAKNSNIVEEIRAEISIPYKHTPSENFSMDIYMGPNQYYTLKKEGHELERLVPLGPVIIRHINKAVIYLFHQLKKVISSYGMIILLMTIIIKSLLFPLVYKSYKSMAKMRVLKPEIDAIKEKHDGDMQTIQKENMALYKKAGVNPAGGCLPMIIQMPVLFAMFRFFPSAFDLRQQGFLWATDLSRYDSVMKLGFDIPFYGDHVSMFTILMTVTTLVYTRFNNQMSGATGQMKWIGYLMPIVFLGFFNNYASGLTYYYFVSTLITFSQQIVIRKFFINEDKIKLQLAENKKNPKKSKTSGFQKRLEDMAKKQQDVNKNKKKK
jgi:YidC/Oxa1 family membrane protein insertase